MKKHPSYQHDNSETLELLQSLKRQVSLLQETVDHMASVEKDLVQAVADMDASILALEQKVDSSTGVVSQAVLDQAVTDLAAQKVRIDAETAKK